MTGKQQVLGLMFGAIVLVVGISATAVGCSYNAQLKNERFQTCVENGGAWLMDQCILVRPAGASRDTQSTVWSPARRSTGS